MLGAGGAIDYVALRVDTSRGAGNAVADTGEDARRRVLRAKLGDLATIEERVIVNGELVSEDGESWDDRGTQVSSPTEALPCFSAATSSGKILLRAAQSQAEA